MERNTIVTTIVVFVVVSMSLVMMRLNRPIESVSPSPIKKMEGTKLGVGSVDLIFEDQENQPTDLTSLTQPAIDRVAERYGEAAQEKVPSLTNSIQSTRDENLETEPSEYADIDSGWEVLENQESEIEPLPSSPETSESNKDQTQTDDEWDFSDLEKSGDTRRKPSAFPNSNSPNSNSLDSNRQVVEYEAKNGRPLVVIPVEKESDNVEVVRDVETAPEIEPAQNQVARQFQEPPVSKLPTFDSIVESSASDNDPAALAMNQVRKQFENDNENSSVMKLTNPDTETETDEVIRVKPSGETKPESSAETSTQIKHPAINESESADKPLESDQPSPIVADKGVDDMRGSLSDGHFELQNRGKSSPPQQFVKDRIELPTRAVQQRAAKHLLYGKSLAQRGSVYAAKDEFIHGLKLIAQSIDQQQETRQHVNALGRGLILLKEADDFTRGDSQWQLGIQIASVVAGHSSKIISSSEADRISTSQAAQMYYESAQIEIAAACGKSAAASEILHALGKLHSVKAQLDSTGKPTDIATAMVMQKAAVLVDQSNYRSAHELGVLMGRSGHWQDARDLFIHSLTLRQMPETWANLKTAHEQLGETDLAARAAAEYQVAVQKTKNDTKIVGLDFRWVGPEHFRQPADSPIISSNTRPVGQTAELPKTPTNTKKSVWNKIKSYF